jgi:hypothetical protein
MKFEVYPIKIKVKGITKRRLSNSTRALQKEREKLPLLSDWVAEQQPTPEERINNFDEGLIKYQKKLRISRAKGWREVRKILSCLSEEAKIIVLNYWNNSRIPKSPEYFLDLMHNKFADYLPINVIKKEEKIIKLIKDKYNDN